ncbi:hypothetical protein [Mycobacterium asiaticum]|nr:hypothetical protein [Mycobacterium asiaticum]
MVLPRAILRVGVRAEECAEEWAEECATAWTGKAARAVPEK